MDAEQQDGSTYHGLEHLLLLAMVESSWLANVSSIGWMIC